MSLSTRLSAFFLGALAVVLAGFSVSLYLVARTYLDRQVDGRLEAALEALSAAVEIKPNYVEWEAQERHLLLGQDADPEQVRWLVHDEEGHLVDRSRNLDSAHVLAGYRPTTPDQPRNRLTDAQGEKWRLGQRHSQTDQPEAARQRPANPKEHQYPSLVLTAGLSLAPMEATLRNLALTVIGLSVGIWLAAAFLGRWLCRQALAPITSMATSARAITAADWDQRLPDPRTGDEIEDLGRAFNELLGRLHEAFEKQSRFTGDASHQLRTPLTAMLGQIEVALRRERSSEDYRDLLKRLQGQAQHLHQIVEMLLFLARAESEARLPDLEVIDLTDWVGEQVQRWSTHPRGKDIRVEGANGEAVPVRVHAPLLSQLIDNLLDNACKYSEPGTPITLRLRHESSEVHCVVEDAGHGIAPQDLPHVFEPFYRSPFARSQGCPGIGLGLAVAQRIAVSFGGQLTAASCLQKGSSLTLSLPAASARPSKTGECTKDDESPHRREYVHADIVQT